MLRDSGGATGSVHKALYAEAQQSAGPVIREQIPGDGDDAVAAGMPVFQVWPIDDRSQSSQLGQL